MSPIATPTPQNAIQSVLRFAVGFFGMTTIVFFDRPWAA